MILRVGFGSCVVSSQNDNQGGGNPKETLADSAQNTVHAKGHGAFASTCVDADG